MKNAWSTYFGLLTGLSLILGNVSLVQAATLEVCQSGCPFPTIQEAIDHASNGDTVLVHDGIYAENIIIQQKQITVRSMNGASTAIIDGQKRGSVIVFSSVVSSDAVLDGFTIRNGLASRGGGIYCTYSYPKISRCIISGNTALSSGGGIYCDGGSPRIGQCIISGNSSVGDGGGIACGFAHPTITNCTITNNSRGALAFIESLPYVSNSILWGNGSAISSSPGWYNGLRIAYSDVEGGYPGIGNIDADPLFTDPGAGNYRLKGGSPCLNAGNPRMYDLDLSRSDMGRYGGEGGPSTTPINMTVALDGSGTFSSIQEAIDQSVNGDMITVLPGVYHENVLIAGKDISIIGRDGSGTTVIDGGQKWSCVSFGNLGSGALLQGFTIQNGFGRGGGGIFCYSASPVINDCLIKNNSAWDGGGIYCNGPSSPQIMHCTIEGNSSRASGGGIYGSANSAPSIIDCIIKGNTAPSYGGGIFCYNSSPAIIGCTISQNSAQAGGGIYCQDHASPSIANSLIERNTATQLGGGILVLEKSSPHITNCTIAKNSAAGGGGFYGGRAYPFFVNTIFWDNGTEILEDVSKLEFSYCDIKGGYSGVGNIDADPLFVDSAAGDYRLGGGSPCRDAGHPLIRDLDLTRSDMGRYGGEGGLTASPLNLIVDWNGNGDFLSIQEAIDNCLEGGTITVLPGTYHENLVVSGKGLFLVSRDGADSTIIDGSGAGTVVSFMNIGTGSGIQGFTIQNGRISGGYGGGISSIYASPRIKNCLIQNNSANMGGGIYCEFSSPWIENCTVRDNDWGGGIYSQNSSPVIADCSISGNEYSGITAGASSMTVTNCTISGNSGSGIAIGGSSSSSTVTDSCISGNSSQDGGGVSVGYSSPTFINCLISGNTATARGGGIYCAEDSAPSFINCDINGNQATYYGGGLYVYSSSPSITGCRINGNSSGMEGGGISFVGSSGIMQDCSIQENSSQRGGAIYQYYSSPKIIRSHVCGNSATADGGGMYSVVSSPVIANCTVSRNTAAQTGDGMYFDLSSSPYISNSILWNGGDEVYSSPDSNPKISYSDIQGGYTGSGNINADPLFTDPGTGDYRLAAGSPCINTGHPRICDADHSRSDMGAHGGEEFCGTVPLTITVDNQGSGDFSTIQEAIDHSLDGDTITVLPGVYHENLVVGGKEISLVGRDGADATIIDGSGSGSVILFAAVGYKVERAILPWNSLFAEAQYSALLKGFTIQNGNAIQFGGGGVSCHFSSPVITECNIERNTGYSDVGGVYLLYSNPLVSNCNIRDNIGGGILGWGSSIIVKNCYITGNQSGHGGIYFGYSASLISNCVISGNQAGGLSCYPWATKLTVLNCTVSGNKGGGFNSGEYNGYWDTTVLNSIFWGNETFELSGRMNVNYSNIQGGWSGVTNINVDSQFIDQRPASEAPTSQGDYHLSEGSPCIDAGINLGTPGDDIDGVRRPQGAGVDMGADEYGAACPDEDGDGVCLEADNCPDVANPDQADVDGDGLGDACDGCTDTDSDGYGNPGYAAATCDIDNCPETYNPGQEDIDRDALGDVCDSCDNRPITGFISPSVKTLWPPKRQLVPVTINVTGLAAHNPVAQAKITKVEILEYTRERIRRSHGEKIHDGNGFEPDVIITGDLSLKLRSEETGGSLGRTYKITVTASDCSGSYEFSTEVNVSKPIKTR